MQIRQVYEETNFSVLKKCRISKKISPENLVNTTKIEHGETSGIWGDKLFLCTKLHDIYVS